MKTGRNYKFWFCTGSQDLYGDECLRKVAEHSCIIVEELNKSGMFPYEIIWKPTLITNELIRKTFNEANADEDCAVSIYPGRSSCCTDQKAETTLFFEIKTASQLSPSGIWHWLSDSGGRSRYQSGSYFTL